MSETKMMEVKTEGMSFSVDKDGILLSLTKTGFEEVSKKTLDMVLHVLEEEQKILKRYQEHFKE